MLSRNRRVPHLMEIYPGASDLHMLLGRRRTGDLQGYPALTHMWLYHIRITTQAEHSPKKGGETKLRSCGSLRTEKSTKTDSKARNGVLITWHTGMAAPTASPNLWWLLASGDFLLLFWPFPCCFGHMDLKSESWVQMIHAWSYSTWGRQVVRWLHSSIFRAIGSWFVSSKSFFLGKLQHKLYSHFLKISGTYGK